MLKDVEIIREIPLCQICLGDKGEGEIPIIISGKKRYVCKYCDENIVWE